MERYGKEPAVSETLRTSPLMYWEADRVYPPIERGEGIYLYGPDGGSYIDAAGGLGCVTSIGHGVREVAEAMEIQAAKVAFPSPAFFSNETTVRAARTILEWAPAGMNKVLPVSIGAAANEDAVKMAWTYHAGRGNRTKLVVISRWQSFHGSTTQTLGLSGYTGRRRPYRSSLVEWPHIPPAYCYRCYFEKLFPDCNLLCARALETAILQEGSENVAAFIAEPVVGSALGFVPAPDGYFQAVREICDRHDVLLICDEVMSGFGRTGRNFAIEHWGVTPDILTCAKGITGGYFPLAAVVVSKKVSEVLLGMPGGFVTGHTYDFHPVAAATCLAVLGYMRKHDLVANSAAQGAYLMERLQQLDHPIVGDVRGRGLMVGLEIVKDRITKEPFPPDAAAGGQITSETMKRGMIVYAGTGNVDGAAGDQIMVAPPLIVRRDQIDDIVSILNSALNAAQRSLMTGG
jgi:adenosylmethionine-8-amino-7-oxononanoate aminotransferase